MPADRFKTLTAAWLALLGLTLFSLALSEYGRDIAWLPVAVAAVMWVKGLIVARGFIESHRAHPFIARVVRVFVAFAPLALLAVAFFGDRIARWATL